MQWFYTSFWQLVRPGSVCPFLSYTNYKNHLFCSSYTNNVKDVLLVCRLISSSTALTLREFVTFLYRSFIL